MCGVIMRSSFLGMGRGVFRRGVWLPRLFNDNFVVGFGDEDVCKWWVDGRRKD